METVLETPTHDSTIPTPLSPNPAPLYAKCLTCPDFVTACRGVDITLLSGSAEKRNYHKAIKKEYGFLIKDIYALVKNTIGKSTTEEYFGPGTGDYKWLTVTTIHNALLFLVAQKKGLPLCEHSCSSSSSEVRNQLAAADLNLAAANVNMANLQTECDDLRRRLAQDVADNGYAVAVAKVALYAPDNSREEYYLAAGPAADAVLTEVTAQSGPSACRTAADTVFLPADCHHWGRKRYAVKLMEILQKKQ
jgi:hypothetical protein